MQYSAKPLKISRLKRPLTGEIDLPADKSITHRAIMLASCAKGKSEIRNWLDSHDTRATLEILISIGTEATIEDKKLIIQGKNMQFQEPKDILDAKNSGTSARLIAGILSTQNFFSVMTGDESLRKRPMDRVIEPLRQMGAQIDARGGGRSLPMAIRGGRLKGIEFENKRASAQVKSSIILAGLGAEGNIRVFEPILSRDHTERMLGFLGLKIKTAQEREGYYVELEGGQIVPGFDIVCPADPSSAAFLASAAALIEGSNLRLRRVLLNKTRIGFFEKLSQMGAKVAFENVREEFGDIVGDIRVEYSGRLKAVEVKPEEVPRMIDEIVMLAVLMAVAKGSSAVRGAKELRVKESDRIKAIVKNLRAMGADIEELEDGFEIEGVESLKGAYIETFSDHRVAMAFSIAGLIADGETYIDNPDCVGVSFRDFYEKIGQIAGFEIP
ncbi:MAG: 3-phosphoshikimate 1-carboxyvinyltransferase [Aquificaceae bacterium]